MGGEGKRMPVICDIAVVDGKFKTLVTATKADKGKIHIIDKVLIPK